MFNYDRGFKLGLCVANELAAQGDTSLPWLGKPECEAERRGTAVLDRWQML